MHGVSINWNTDSNIPGPTPLDRTDSPSTIRHQPLATSSSSAGGGASWALPHLCWNVGWLDLVHILLQHWELLCVPESSSPVVSRRHCFAAVCPDLWLCALLTAPPLVSPAFGCGSHVWFAAVHSAVVHSLLFGLLGVCINHHQKTKTRTSLLRDKSCTILGMSLGI